MKEVISFLRNQNIDVLGLLETRIKCSKAAAVINHKLHPYKVTDNYDFHKNERIWVIWNPSSVTLVPLTVHAQYVHCLIKHHETNVKFQATFIYASNDSKVREVLWDGLGCIGPLNSSWVTLRDFNVVRDITERISEHPPNLFDMLAFNACLLQCGLEDMQCTGCEFTWTNKQDEARVWCKLDRALVNDAWLGQFPSTSAKFHVPGISDHSSVLVTLFEDIRPKKRFSFLNRWISDPYYDSLVREAWATPVTGSVMSKLFAKMKNVRRSLMDLHKRSYTAIQLRVANAKKDLDECQAQLQASPMNFCR
ncbi:hypothetical protein RND81_03G183400 [Saponaria officinalis]|uniref:Endonuclease/exonuclease/phosphatase domain-containing protein n=1 Tax=Saponaria officinalis TaxID=3572 RepID=A0AAW1M189_SAPOF